MEAEEEKRLEGKSAEEILDEKDSEGMATHWVQVKNPSSSTKLHLPPEGQGGVDPMKLAHPRCGLTGQFEFKRP